MESLFSQQSRKCVLLHARVVAKLQRCHVFQRYGHGLNIEEESEMYVMSEDGSQVTPVEMVGTEKISKKQG